MKISSRSEKVARNRRGASPHSRAAVKLRNVGSSIARESKRKRIGLLTYPVHFNGLFSHAWPTTLLLETWSSRSLPLPILPVSAVSKGKNMPPAYFLSLGAVNSRGC